MRKKRRVVLPMVTQSKIGFVQVCTHQYPKVMHWLPSISLASKIGEDCQCWCEHMSVVIDYDLNSLIIFLYCKVWASFSTIVLITQLYLLNKYLFMLQTQTIVWK